MPYFSNHFRGSRKAALLILPLLIIAPWPATAGPPTEVAPSLDLDQPVRVLEKAVGEYPKTMIVYKTRGFVTTEVLIDKDGRPTKPRVLACTHFEFEAPAVEATLAWKFVPARQKGLPVEAPVKVSIEFDILGGRVGNYHEGTPAFVVPAKAPPDYPAEFQYDDAPFPLLHCRPVYPRELLMKNVKGHATLIFLVDPSGRPRRIEVSETSRPEFGAAARAMIGAWRFTPAKKQGKPTWTTLSYKQLFNKADRETPFSPMTAKLLDELKSDTPAIVDGLSGLDKRPRIRYQAEPTVPDEVVKAGRVETAEIEFIIDEKGHVQLPRIVSSTHEDFGWAAATAVARWIFTPPIKDGKQANVIMRIPIEYTPPVQPATASKS
jgi:TonB family protein